MKEGSFLVSLLSHWYFFPTRRGREREITRSGKGRKELPKKPDLSERERERERERLFFPLSISSLTISFFYSFLPRSNDENESEGFPVSQ